MTAQTAVFAPGDLIEMQLKICEEYVEFKRKSKDMMKAEGEHEDIVLFKTRSCHPGCERVLPVGFKARRVGARTKDCPLEGAVMEPRQPNLMRMSFLNLYLKFDF